MKEIDPIKVGERIREKRKQAGYSQSRLADELSTHQSIISDIEKGEKLPDTLFLARFSQKFDLTIDWVITGKDTMALFETKPLPTYDLSEDEKAALTTAENLLRYQGLDKHFVLAEKQVETNKGEQLTGDEARLIAAYRQVDKSSKDVILTVAESTAVAFKQGEGRSRPGESGSPAANCA